MIGASQVIIRQDQMPHTKFEGKPTLVGLVWALDDSPTVAIYQTLPLVPKSSFFSLDDRKVRVERFHFYLK